MAEKKSLLSKVRAAVKKIKSKPQIKKAATKTKPQIKKAATKTKSVSSLKQFKTYTSKANEKYMSKSPVVELKLPVLPDMELSATQTAEVVARHMELSEEKSAEISMALIEACINAFEHSGSDKQIEIHFRIKEDLLEIQVTDKGKGFDKSKVKIPKIEEKIISDRKRGWGLQLIKELMDTVEFESSGEGTTVTMTKKK